MASGAMALGALAVGAMAIGALAIGRLKVGRARIRRLEIDELVIHRVQRSDARPVGGSAKALHDGDGPGVKYADDSSPP